MWLIAINYKFNVNIVKIGHQEHRIVDNWIFRPIILTHHNCMKLVVGNCNVYIMN